MRARTGALAGVAATVVATAACAGSAPAALHRSCAPRGAEVLARDARVVVYSAPDRGGAATLACLLGHRGRMTLIAGGGRATHHNLFPQLDRVILSGAIVAFEENLFGVDSGDEGITVADVAHRTILRTIPGVGAYTDAGFLYSRIVTQLVLSANGSVAWLVEEGRRGQTAPMLRRVYAAAVRGPVSLLAEGTDIAPESLKLSGATLSWFQAGAAHTAPMP